jgi:exo-1,4-beta-D-glucosaminidase
MMFNFLYLAVAFQIRLRLRDANAPATAFDVLPIEWSDNYVTLMPGDSETITALYLTASVTSSPVLITESYNDLVVCS